MEIINVISSIGTLVIALIGIWIAIAQLKSANRAAHASRMAEMSWQVYQAYTDSKIRDARGAAEKIAHTVPALTSGVEYGKKYADKKQFVPEPKKLTLDIHIRRLLRFYNQVGILMEKNLVDDDLVFELIGPGLESVWSVVSSAVEWYQNYYGGSTGREKAKPRLIYNHIPKLYKRYTQWKEKA